MAMFFVVVVRSETIKVLWKEIICIFIVKFVKLN